MRVVAHASLVWATTTDFHNAMNSPLSGYAEGFYGRLLSWPERRQIIDALQRLGLTTYYYAPKEDPCHRLHWRTPYAQRWREEFNSFCTYAHECEIRVVAGVAPGLDFNFADLPGGTDFACLVAKSKALIDDGADVISLLMDDIDADFDKRCGGFDSEGMAHAALANALGDALAELTRDTGKRNKHLGSLWVTPRIYADELIAESPEYVPDFVQRLNKQHCVLYCGSDVVAHTVNGDSANALLANSGESGVGGEPGDSYLKHRVIIWDNLYANDYCPRRLFVGPWVRRGRLRDVLLNPTGMVHTDCLLLELMAAGMRQAATVGSEQENAVSAWRSILSDHGVPPAFRDLAPYFAHPHFNIEEITDEVAYDLVNTEPVRVAIEHCLWRWKTPLSREWYTYIFGLKHDLLTRCGHHSPDRILKTQTAPLAHVLLTRDECGL